MNARIKRIAAWAAGGACFALLLVGAMLLPQTGSNGVPAVALSRESGFYDDPFDLEMSFDGGRIYYTLDSSEPDENATLYEGPIRIEDASANPNVYADITDVSLEFNPDILERYQQGSRFGYQTPTASLDKATVVRAVGIDASGRRSDVVNAAYFVGFGQKTGYDRMGIIAITTDPANLFDYDRGIYVTGKAFEDGLSDEMYDLNQLLYESWPANYNQRGRAWERPASICCFDVDRNVIFSGNCGIRIQGGVSRGMLPKSLNIYARDEYGQSMIPGQALFGVNWQLTSMNLNSGSESYRTRIHDCLVNTLADGLNFDTRLYKPYEMFLNGEYWGVYWLTPRYEKAYFQCKYGVSGNDVVVIKDGEVEVGIEDDVGLYTAMRSFICDGDMTDPAMYAQACGMIDIQSCIDYYATEAYIVNIDWPQKNVGLWRTRGIDGGAWGDGRWRWILYDVNVAMAVTRAEVDYVPKAMKRDPLFASLMHNESFSRALNARMVELAEDQFNPARVETWIREYEISMLDAMENEYGRFYNDAMDRTDFISACQRKIDFFYRRSVFALASYGDQRKGEPTDR